MFPILQSIPCDLHPALKYPYLELVAYSDETIVINHLNEFQVISLAALVIVVIVSWCDLYTS